MNEIKAENFWEKFGISKFWKAQGNKLVKWGIQMPESFRPSHLLTFFRYRPKIDFLTFEPISRVSLTFLRDNFLTFLRIAYVIRYLESCEMGISKVTLFAIMIFAVLVGWVWCTFQLAQNSDFLSKYLTLRT